MEKKKSEHKLTFWKYFYKQEVPKYLMFIEIILFLILTILSLYIGMVNLSKEVQAELPLILLLLFICYFINLFSIFVMVYVTFTKYKQEVKKINN